MFTPSLLYINQCKVQMNLISAIHQFSWVFIFLSATFLTFIWWYQSSDPSGLCWTSWHHGQKFKQQLQSCSSRQCESIFFKERQWRSNSKSYESLSRSCQWTSFTSHGSLNSYRFITTFRRVLWGVHWFQKISSGSCDVHINTVIPRCLFLLTSLLLPTAPHVANSAEALGFESSDTNVRIGSERTGK